MTENAPGPMRILGLTWAKAVGGFETMMEL